MFIFRDYFKTQSDQNMQKNALNCTKLHQIFSGSYAPEPLSIYVYIIINMYFYMKIVIFYSSLFQNAHHALQSPKRINRETLPNISSRELPHSKRVSI